MSTPLSDAEIAELREKYRIGAEILKSEAGIDAVRFLPRLLDELEAVKAERDEWKDEAELKKLALQGQWVEKEKLAADRDRLLAGTFTPDEIHGICHNLHGTVDADAFAEGCRQEMLKLYGRYPWDEKLSLLEKLERRVEENPGTVFVGGCPDPVPLDSLLEEGAELRRKVAKDLTPMMNMAAEDMQRRLQSPTPGELAQRPGGEE